MKLTTSLGLLMVVIAAQAAALEVRSVASVDVEESDIVYAAADTLELKAHVYRPRVAGTLPALIDIHGGAWSSGDRMQGRHYARALASAGIFVFSIDFRQAPAFQHPSASRDVASAVRYLRRHAQELRIDATSIGLVGSSSGGHLAMLAGFQPNHADFRGTAIAIHNGFAKADDSDASVRYVIALWPVSDPAYRYEYAKRVGRDELVKSHDRFFGTTEHMRQASVPRLLRAKEAQQLPPLFVVHAGKDANIPPEMTLDLVTSYQEAGGALTYQVYPNQPHAFGHRASAATDHLILAMRDFIAAHVR